MKVTTDGCLFGAIAASQLQKGPLKVLDIGTGTGLLTLMLAQVNQQATIHAIEIEEQAALQAGENIAASPWSERITVYHQDIKDYQPTDKYDCIISNPPFYENELKSDDRQKNKAHHDEGLLLSKLFTIIKQLLAPGGRFYILLPFKRKREAEILCKDMQLAIHHTILVRQSVTTDYFRVIVDGQHVNNDEPVIETELTIRDKDQQYTAEFTNLLKAYYLYL